MKAILVVLLFIVAGEIGASKIYRRRTRSRSSLHFEPSMAMSKLQLSKSEHSSSAKLVGSEKHAVRTAVVKAFASKSYNSSLAYLAEKQRAVDCNLTLTEASKNHFRYKVNRFGKNFIYTHLNFSPLVNLTFESHVIGPQTWTWTYFGDEGGFFFLKQPVEGSIWSLGLLTQTIDGIVELELTTNNCSISLRIGDDASSYIIGMALKDIVHDLYRTEPDYEASFWCYKKRRYIERHWLYILCLHVVCPIQTGEYRCCANHFYPKEDKRVLDCGKSNTFVNDYLWYIPFISGCLFCLHMPLFVFWFAWKISPESASPMTSRGMSDDSEDGLKINDDHFIFLTEENVVSLFNTMFSACSRTLSQHAVLLSRLKRIFFILLTLSIIALQLTLDSLWIIGDFVTKCVEAGIPMGFRSLRTGYGKSSSNFLPYLGGPVTALSVYFIISFVCIVFPDNLPKQLDHGLVKHIDKEAIWTPLLLGNDLLERLSSVDLSKDVGYRKYVDLLQMNMYCILNSKFWKIGFSIQKARFRKLPYTFFRIILFIPYLTFCLVENLCCILFYGFPLFSNVKIFLKAYSVGVLVRTKRFIKITGLCFIFNSICLVIGISAATFYTFMLCTIFLDAVIFLSRIFVYTYEGIVLYPKTSYGYIIFVFTVIYYIVQIKNNFSKFYQHLLRRLIKVSSKHKAVYIDGSAVVKRRNHYQGVPATVFNEVVERIKPKRVKLFTSLVQMGLIIFITGLTIHLMLFMNRFKHIHVLVHVGTTLFICALPKLIGKVSYKQDKFATRKLDDKILKTLKDFVSFQDEMSANTSIETYHNLSTAYCDYSITVQ